MYKYKQRKYMSQQWRCSWKRENRMKFILSHKLIFKKFLSPPLNVNVDFCNFKIFTLFIMKPKVLVLCFPYFTNNYNITIFIFKMSNILMVWIMVKFRWVCASILVPIALNVPFIYFMESKVDESHSGKMSNCFNHPKTFIPLSRYDMSYRIQLEFQIFLLYR